MSNMTETDNTTPATISRPAIGALIAGIVAVILFLSNGFNDQAWTAVAVAASVILAAVDVVEARRTKRPISYLATIGAILAVVTFVLAFIVWPSIR